MGYPCAFKGCNRKATRYEILSLHPIPGGEPAHAEVRPFCDWHCGEEESHDHVASASNPKICSRCGIHVDSLR